MLYYFEIKFFLYKSESWTLNPLVPDCTLKYVFSKKSFRYFFSHNTSIFYPILKI